MVSLDTLLEQGAKLVLTAVLGLVSWLAISVSEHTTHITVLESRLAGIELTLNEVRDDVRFLRDHDDGSSSRRR